MPKEAPVSDFVRNAIVEKATRELSTLEQQLQAFDILVQAKGTLDTVATDVGARAAAIIAAGGEAAPVGSKVKKLRKALDEARVLVDEIGESLGIEAKRAEIETARQSIFDALSSAGIERESLFPAPGGDAQ
jgi:hypothetical protein